MLFLYIAILTAIVPFHTLHVDFMFLLLVVTCFAIAGIKQDQCESANSPLPIDLNCSSPIFNLPKLLPEGSKVTAAKLDPQKSKFRLGKKCFENVKNMWIEPTCETWSWKNEEQKTLK